MFGRRRNDTVETVREHQHPRWSPAQIVALVIGIASVLLGAVAWIRTGWHPRALPQPTDTVLGFHQTQFLAIVEIGFGVVMILAAMRPAGVRSVLALLGAAQVGLGVVLVADWWPARMHHWLGVHDRYGWTIIAVGGIALLSGLLLPTLGGGRTVVRERRPIGEPDVVEDRRVRV